MAKLTTINISKIILIGAGACALKPFTAVIVDASQSHRVFHFHSLPP